MLENVGWSRQFIFSLLRCLYLGTVPGAAVWGIGTHGAAAHLWFLRLCWGWKPPSVSISYSFRIHGLVYLFKYFLKMGTRHLNLPNVLLLIPQEDVVLGIFTAMAGCPWGDDRGEEDECAGPPWLLPSPPGVAGGGQSQGRWWSRMGSLLETLRE